MSYRSLRVMSAIVVAFTCGVVLIQADQIRRQSPGESQVSMEVSLKVAGEAYEATGAGSCTHAPKASIYGVLSEMWSVRQKDAGGHSVQLTLWKPNDGSANMFNLSVTATKSVNISTIRGGQVVGSGSVTLAPAGKGGTFTIDAKTRSGEAVAGTIKCDAFTPAIAEGGN